MRDLSFPDETDFRIILSALIILIMIMHKANCHHRKGLGPLIVLEGETGKLSDCA
jgi:hypothetical protein